MKVAIIVQRAGKEFTGGSEDYAMNLARLIREFCPVDILTTTAADHNTWANTMEEGEEELDIGMTLKRFQVDQERGDYWKQIFGKVEDASNTYCKARGVPEHSFYRQLPIGLAEEWVKAQGPYSSSLLRYLKDYNTNYDRFIFLTYLYATTYFGVSQILDPERVCIIPTYHDEFAAYMPVFRKYLPYKQYFLTASEQKAAEEQIYGERLRGEILGFGLADKSNHTKSLGKDLPETYILYAGRLEEGKGVKTLFQFFERFHEKHPELHLVTIGNGDLKDYEHPAIHYMGFVSDEEKRHLMKNALALVHPSPFESLSIVLLEAFMMGTPGLVNGHCQVLKEHIDASGGGASYTDESTFTISLEKLLLEPQKSKSLGLLGRQYYEEQYSEDSYVQRIESQLLGPGQEIGGA